jgi:hypothetical protein
MNLRIFGYVLLALVLLAGTFYLGFLYGHRQYFNQQPDDVEVIASNQAQRNSLSDIQVKDIWGAVKNKKSSGFGELYFKSSKDKTELLVRLRNVPLKVTGNNTDLQLPATLKIETAALTDDGLNYIYEQIGTINLDEPQDGKRDGEFSTILDYSIFEVDRKIDRIIFRAENEEIQNVFLDEDPNLPAQVRREPAPFFWVVL